MNRFLLISALVLFAALNCSAQENASGEKPVYLRFPTIPLFTLAKASDSTSFTRDDLKKKVSTIFFIFSPDCNHCQYETGEIIKNIKKFKNAQIVMITYFPWEQMMPYYRQFKIANYPQITMARDNNYFFPIFYNVKNFPSTFIYDNKGNFRKGFDGAVKIQDILNEL